MGNFVPRSLTVLMSLLFVVGLSSCVSTTNSNVNVNKQAAHDKRIELGMKYLQVGRRENARFQFSNAMELQKNSAEAYQGIAMVHMGNGEMEAAGEAFTKAMRYADDDNRSTIQVAFGRYQMELGNDSAACEYFEKAGQDYDYSARAEALYLAALCAEKIGNAVRVLPALEHALNINPNYKPVIIKLSEMYFANGNYAACKKMLDKFDTVSKPTAASLWLGIRIERIFGNKNKEASYALALKNRHPYSKEYLEYKRLKEAAE